MGEPKLEKLLDAQDISEATGYNIGTIWRWTREGRIEHVKELGRPYRYTFEMYQRFLNGTSKKKK